MAKFSASFRIMGDDLVPEDISIMLGREPDEAHRKGDPRVGKSGRRYSDFTSGLWALESAKDDRSLAVHLEELLGKLEGREASMRELHGRGYHLDIFVGVFGGTNIEFNIAPDLLERLGRLQLELVLDIYSCE